MLALTSDIPTPIHRVPVGWKLAALCLSTVALFSTDSPLGLALAVAVVGGLYATGGARFMAQGARLLWPLWPFVVVAGLWHLWNGNADLAMRVTLRLVAAVGLANLVTLTSRLSDMLEVLERLARPLRHLGLSPRALSLAVALVIRFTPVLLDKAGALRQAWRARSARRVGWRIILPLTLAALDDADHVAEALRARGGL